MAEAADGEDALRRLDVEGELDLVLLDWRMPGRSGADVLRELKRERPELPVVVLTAELRADHRELAESLGADAFLTKPFSPLELLKTIERLLHEGPLDETA